MFIVIYIVLLLIVLVLTIIFFKKLFKLGKDASYSEQRTHEIASKLEDIKVKTNDLVITTNHINENMDKYGPTFSSALTILGIIDSAQRNFRKKSLSKAIFRSARKIIRPKSINSFKTLAKLFK